MAGAVKELIAASGAAEVAAMVKVLADEFQLTEFAFFSLSRSAEGGRIAMTCFCCLRFGSDDIPQE